MTVEEARACALETHVPEPPAETTAPSPSGRGDAQGWGLSPARTALREMGLGRQGSRRRTNPLDGGRSVAQCGGAASRAV